MSKAARQWFRDIVAEHGPEVTVTAEGDREAPASLDFAVAAMTLLARAGLTASEFDFVQGVVVNALQRQGLGPS